jgi:hypothetical protein
MRIAFLTIALFLTGVVTDAGAVAVTPQKIDKSGNGSGIRTNPYYASNGATGDMVIECIPNAVGVPAC